MPRLKKISKLSLLYLIITIVVVSSLVVPWGRLFKRFNNNSLPADMFQSVPLPKLDKNIQSSGSRDSIVWFADHETGNLFQWSASGERTSYDSGKCNRPQNGVSSKIAHTGQYSMKMSIDSSYQGFFNKSVHSGCRQFRYKEAQSGQPYFYSAWYYLPERYSVPKNHFAMLGQFKAKPEGADSDPIWSYQIQNRDNSEMYLTLTWGGSYINGPRIEDTGKYPSRTHFTQDGVNLPVGKWFHIEVYLEQSADYNGKVMLWQDGVLIYNFENVVTKYSTGHQSWSVTSYGYKIKPDIFTVYVDDVIISTQRLGPEFKL